MANYQKNFDAYKLYHYAPSAAQTVIQVNCYVGTSQVGSIGFYKDEGQIIPNKYTSASISIFYPLSQFNNVIDTLRKEKPLFLWINDEGFGYLSTSENEPTGEEEGRI